MPSAAAVKPGQWLIRTNGAYLVDAVAVKGGLAYIGTKHGVLVLPLETPVLVGEGQ